LWELGLLIFKKEKLVKPIGGKEEEAGRIEKTPKIT
jgi:hypothetical protein